MGERVINVIVNLFPSEEMQINYWQICEQLLSHALVYITITEQWSEENILRFKLMKYWQSIYQIVHVFPRLNPYFREHYPSDSMCWVLSTPWWRKYSMDWPLSILQGNMSKQSHFISVPYTSVNRQ